VASRVRLALHVTSGRFVRRSGLGSFGCAATKFPGGSAATGPGGSRTMGILPYFGRPDHRDLNRSDVLLTCGGSGERSAPVWQLVFAPTDRRG
jgi:hypothetical protein